VDSISKPIFTNFTIAIIAASIAILAIAGFAYMKLRKDGDVSASDFAPE